MSVFKCKLVGVVGASDSYEGLEADTVEQACDIFARADFWESGDSVASRVVSCVCENGDEYEVEVDLEEVVEVHSSVTKKTKVGSK